MSQTPRIIAVDFETKPIMDRPEYPPEPVGVALKHNGRWKYLAWGHPTQNNCTKAEAKKILREVFTKHIPLFHNSAFDISVARHHMGLPFPKHGYHDTLFLAYLNDPREPNLSLKPLADKYLDMPPDEQAELKEWILANTDCKDTKKDPWGAHIWEAPGKLVGKYAIGDVLRTERLFKTFYPSIKERGMLSAYERELNVMPIFESMSETGICVAVKKLKRDLKQWEKKQAERLAWIKKRLKVKDPEWNINSSAQLADALDAAGKIDYWEKTPKGNRCTKRDALIRHCNDKKLVEELGRYSVMETFINTFAKPWIEKGEKYGRVYPSFNQVRSPDEYGKGGGGTRTGRPSSFNPNLLNIPRNQEDPELPNMRNYLIPSPGMAFIIRDYSQQELRILAHFEEGKLYQAYLEDPNTDAHEMVGDEIEHVVHRRYPRKHVKIVNFGVVYGMGKPGVAQKIEGSMEEAAELLDAHGKALPGVRELMRAITKHSKKGNPIYTWGGREYYAEEPKIIGGRRKDFHYKLLNYLIQGSAADCTKEAMIRAEKRLRKLGGRIVLQVYDEIVAEVPVEKIDEGMKELREAMESIEFDVPMLSDGKVGKRSWGQAVKYKDRR